MRRILIFSSENVLPPAITSLLSDRGYEVLLLHSEQKVSELLLKDAVDLAIIGTYRRRYGINLVTRFRQDNDGVRLILITADGTTDLPDEDAECRPDVHFQHPVPPEKVVSAAHDLLKPAPVLTNEFSALAGADEMVGESALIYEVKAYIQRIARTDCNVLITGETGTGKELVAQLIHKNSRRRDYALVCLNCAAIPDTLLESELFGYEKGAFTGAQTAYTGRLRQADKGTIFFDEIGDMTMYSQAKILRALETREVQQLGGRRSYPVDVRVIAATNRDVDSLADTNSFRSDLYFRLNVARIHLPPLRERKSDIPLLFDHFRRIFNERLGLKVRCCTDEVLQALLAYQWPGNIREFRNVVEAIFVNSPGTEIRLHDIPAHFRSRLITLGPAGSLSEEERVLLALAGSQWNKSKAAERLSCSRMTLYRKMAKYQIRATGIPSGPLAEPYP